MPEAEDYLGPEAKARVEIDKQLTAVGWAFDRFVAGLDAPAVGAAFSWRFRA